jgi:hypothetical protein
MSIDGDRTAVWFAPVTDITAEEMAAVGWPPGDDRHYALRRLVAVYRAGRAAAANPGTMRIELTDAEAAALYAWLESADAPPYWWTPLAPVQARLSQWYRDEMPIPGVDTTDPDPRPTGAP